MQRRRVEVETLYLTSYGIYLAKKKDVFIIRLGDSKEKVSARKVEKIVFLGPGKAISVDAIRLAVKFKIPIYLAYSNGYPYAMVFPVIATGTVKTRRAQYEAITNRIGVELVLEIIRGKLMNQYTLLKFFWKSRKRTEPEIADLIKLNAEGIKQLATELRNLDSESIDKEFRTKVLNIEARAADYYWPAFSLLLPPRFHFQKRVKPGAKDPVNALLNLGYSLLFMVLAKEIVYSGLDPYAGFLQVDRPGRESLVLDMMEEFRQWCVDRLVVKFLVTRKLTPEDVMDKKHRLKRQIVADFCAMFEEHMETVALNMRGEKRTLMMHISNQIRMLKRHLLRAEKYKPCIFTW